MPSQFIYTICWLSSPKIDANDMFLCLFKSAKTLGLVQCHLENVLPDRKGWKTRDGTCQIQIFLRANKF